jgi:hypothetical protein
MAFRKPGRRNRGRLTPVEMLATATVRRVSCRFCSEWNRPVWLYCNGRRVSGFALLEHHVEFEHGEEYERLQRRLDDTCKTEPEPSP